MQLRAMPIVFCLLMSAHSMSGQSIGRLDPVTGTWKGYMGAAGGDARRTPLTIDLKLDETSGVTGSVTGPPQPGDIRTGVYEQATGTLRFSVTVSGNENPFVFEGTLFLGTVTGRITVGATRGIFLISKAGADGAVAAQRGGSEVLSQMRKSFVEVSSYVARSAELVPTDKFDFRPKANVRTFGQIIGHIADSYKYYCNQAAGRKAEWSDAIEKGATDKATVVAKLRQSVDACDAAYVNDASKTAPLIDNLSHTNQHYGNIITYLRLLGLAPPSS